MMKRKIILYLGVLLFALLFLNLIPLISSQGGNQGTQVQTVCCEETNNGAFCQNVPESECKPGSQQVPTSCESTSYCKAGTCYDSTEGTCLDNTPQLVCNANGGVWSVDSPPQCSLGCCILGDQAAYVSLVRCKRLSSFLGLKTNYDSGVSSELACVEKVQQQEVGACVYEFEFEKTCKFGTRAECDSQTGNASIVGGTFYPEKLCSAEELGTVCGPTTRTTCIPGKDEVYFVDTCGNPANIYDSSKIQDQGYWTDIISSGESCNPSDSNANNVGCGNCDYLQGSICRNERDVGKSATYGDFICADLNCENTLNGENYKHGESWCVYDDAGGFGNSDNSVGSRFYKHICINGEEVLEQCEDFRAEECISDKVNDFSQAACRVNRWQDCLQQSDEPSCENVDIRDCVWKEGIFLQNLQNQTQDRTGTCFPENKPGFDFWSDIETSNLCSVGSDVCVVKFEEDLFGGEKCVENCHCLEEGWEKDRADICKMVGDCGPAINWIGKEGYNKGYKITSEDV
jgi:hypothetical protein